MGVKRSTTEGSALCGAVFDISVVQILAHLVNMMNKSQNKLVQLWLSACHSYLLHGRVCPDIEQLASNMFVCVLKLKAGPMYVLSGFQISES